MLVMVLVRWGHSLFLELSLKGGCTHDFGFVLGGYVLQ